MSAIGGAGACKPDDLDRLILRLLSLLDGEQAAADLVACGPPAVAPLRRFLLDGRPASLPQPRLWAVRALAGLQAWDVLVEYLRHPPEIPDAEVRFAEEVVENAAALALAAWGTEEAFRVLLEVAAERLRPGVIEGLARFGRVAATLYLVDALTDDFCRPVAEEGLRRLGPAAMTPLVTAVCTRRPSAADESPSNLRRRRSALRLLRDIGCGPECWARLRALLGDSMESDPQLLGGLAAVAFEIGSSADRTSALDRLLDVLPQAGWDVQDELEPVLAQLFAAAPGRLAQELARQGRLTRASTSPASAADPLQRLLARIGRRLSR
ncbi:MAG TPA: hypothetical protein VND92_11550 [Vicinamibacterales bacterium]|nr:hypothetical protein [Vicinamibacterales bacterium]